MKTKSEILEDFGCPVPDFHENVTMYYPAIHSAMEEYAQRTAIEFAEWCIVHAWEIDYREQKSHTISKLFAKFEAERTPQ